MIAAADAWQRRELARVDEEVQSMTRCLAGLRATADVEAERRTAAERRCLDEVLTILESKEMEGMRAEVEVAQELRRLPDEYHVLHHLQLEARHFLRCDGEPLQFAEVDHVVVGPTGIYLLKTRCWGGRLYVEHWGMEKDPKYAERKAMKVAVYARHGLQLVELTEDDFANLDEALPWKLLKFGIECD
ncbi:MAG: hypothetical protein HMLKMBBP_01362 [Planctomycetes bacterium]|nr:hypothetical protein [Planctomycetota bacterium]